jgi:hypothetical protein
LKNCMLEHYDPTTTDADKECAMGHDPAYNLRQKENYHDAKNMEEMRKKWRIPKTTYPLPPVAQVECPTCHILPAKGKRCKCYGLADDGDVLENNREVRRFPRVQKDYE